MNLQKEMTTISTITMTMTMMMTLNMMMMMTMMMIDDLYLGILRHAAMTTVGSAWYTVCLACPTA